MQRSGMFVAILGLVGACTHEMTTTMPMSTLAGDTVTVTTSGQEVDARVRRAQDGGYVLVDERSQVVTPESITQIAETNRGMGLLQGLGIGVLTGAALGVGIGIASGDDPPCDMTGGDWCLFNMTAGEKAVFAGAVLGSLGGLVGAAVGFAVGQHDVWTIGTSPTSGSAMRITPVGPAGSVAGLSMTF